MNKTVKQKPPFSAWYVREFENYLSDMAKEGKRFSGSLEETVSRKVKTNNLHTAYYMAPQNLIKDY